jgi:hypothetical protein
MKKDDLTKLTEPFSAHEIEWRIGSTTKDKAKGMALAYLTNRAIMNRLDDVCGQSDWANEFERWGEKGARCGISIYIEDKWVTKYDGAEDTNIEATKGGFSDSMKRAAVQWGMGRYLYDLPSVWVPLKFGYMDDYTKKDLMNRYQKYIEKKYNIKSDKEDVSQVVKEDEITTEEVDQMFNQADK